MTAARAARALLPIPGPIWGMTPERVASMPRTVVLSRGLRRYAQRVGALAAASSAAEQRWRQLPESDLTLALRRLRQDLRRHGLKNNTLVEALGAVSCAAWHALGVETYATQHYAAIVLLDGRLAEMATGEGKTLAVALAAAVAGLAGTPVHVITANDYLVHRDSTVMTPFYQRLGLSVGCITAALPVDARRIPYSTNVVYCTAKELVFDYLRDGIAANGRRSDVQQRAAALAAIDEAAPVPLIRGLCMAIIDEADSILIDEATVPLIISRERRHHDRRAFLWQSMAIARQMNAGQDFTVQSGQRQVDLTATGAERLDSMVAGLGGPWRRSRYAKEAVRLALTAQHLLRRDEDYLVREGLVVPLDTVTGRAAPGRVWSRGLHTLLELKELCTITPETESVARITYQQFFPRYLKLCGMSGSLTEARRELHAVYGLRVARVPLRRRCARRNEGGRLFGDPESRWTAVLERICEMRDRGRPVLVGVDSIQDANSLALRLTSAGIAHAVLHAHNDANEAEIIARAGQAGQVTVATRMAGRGTDIRLGPGVADAGGLHVINCQWNASRRLDRQLAGRAGRQGDPGSVEICYRCDADRGIGHHFSAQSDASPRNTARWTFAIPTPTWLLGLAATWLQCRLEARQERIRTQLLLQEQKWARLLTFSREAP